MSKKISIQYIKDNFLEHKKELNYSQNTIENYNKAVEKFIMFLSQIKNNTEINITENKKSDIQKYYEYLLKYRFKKNKKLKRWSIIVYMRGIIGFFKFTVKQGYLIFDPTEGIRLRKPDNNISDKIMSKKEIEKILSLIDYKTVIGLRDRTIIEVLYSTGIRRRELINLNMYDIDYENGYLRVNLGKGKKDRIIPIGKRACEWLRKYLIYSRPQLIKDTSDKGLFISQYGRRMKTGTLDKMIQFIMKKAKLKYSTHSFRHSFATGLLKGGADIRYVQEMLGHADIGSTEIYTRVLVDDLRATLNRTHPRAEKYRNKNKKKRKRDEATGGTSMCHP